MRKLKTQKVNKKNPIDFFQEQPQLLFTAIADALEIFFKNDSDTLHCCNIFYGGNTKLHHHIARQIKLLLQSDLGMDLLVNGKNFFQEDYQYLPYILVSLNDQAAKNNVTYDPPLNLTNIQNVLWKVGQLYESKIDIYKDDAQINKIFKILDRFKIVFFRGDLDRNSIITPPMQGFIFENISIRNLSAVLEFILKKTVTDSFVIYTDDQAGTITITRPTINFLSEFQKKILNHSKAIMQNYFARKSIKILKDPMDILEQDNSERDGLNQTSEKKQIYSTNIEFKALKGQIENDLGHYHLTINYIETEYHNCFEFIQSKKTEIITKFFENLYDQDDDTIFVFTGIDSIVAIVQTFLSEKNLNDLKTIKPDKQSEQFMLRIPMNSASTKNLCYGRLNMVLPSLSLNLMVAESKLSIEFTSTHPVVLLMMEVKLKGLKDAFTHLLTNYGGIEAYQGSHTHLVEQKSPQKLPLWKGLTYITETSRDRYLRLSKSIRREDGLITLFEIQKILGDDFEVGLLDNEELIRVNDIPKSVTHNNPRPSFFSQYDNKDEKVKLILRKISYKGEINSQELQYLNQKRPLKSKAPQILIRGLNDHNTCLLEYFYTYAKISAINLPDLIKNIVFEYLGDEVTNKSFAGLSKS